MTHVRTSATLICLVASLALTGCGKSSPKKQPAAPKAANAAANAATNAATNDAPNAAKAAPAKQDKPATAPKKKVKVTLWHAYRDAERKALDQIIDGWNKAHPETQVTTLAVPFDALIDKAQVAIPRGNGPDLIIFAHDKVGVWARDQLIQPLGDFATGERLKRFLPQTVKTLVFERAVYGLPLAFKSTALFYNKKLVPTPPKTVAELVTMSKKLTDAKAGRFGLAYDAADLYYHASWLHGFGGQVFDETSRSLTIDSPAAIQAAERVRALHKNDGVLPKGMTGFVVTRCSTRARSGSSSTARGSSARSKTSNTASPCSLSSPPASRSSPTSAVKR